MENVLSVDLILGGELELFLDVKVSVHFAVGVMFVKIYNDSIIFMHVMKPQMEKVSSVDLIILGEELELF